MASLRPVVRFAERALRNVYVGSVSLAADGLDHFVPLLGFVGDEPAKVCGRDDKQCSGRVNDGANSSSCSAVGLRRTLSLPPADRQVPVAGLLVAWGRLGSGRGCKSHGRGGGAASISG